MSIGQLETVPFQSVKDGKVATIPTHLNFAVYDNTGTRIKQVNQIWGDSNYGTAAINLEKGKYQLVMLAHSSQKNPTMTNLAKVQFNNSIGYTDTYLYYGTLNVGDEPLVLSIGLNRIVALCRFVISDSVPEGVTQMKFTYTGGSGHFSALTGLGVTNSTQTITTAVETGQKYSVFDLYTFLHHDTGTISLTATGLDASGNGRYQKKFEIPLRLNQITWFSGAFFAGDDDTSHWTANPNVSFDMLWGSEAFYTY
ncbi:MAG: FimB/Mfa2 family fimbrial subunit [Prevotella sp.]|nr:FimB/Mfa2 family fimbrial subunit [Prevotella sp.]